MSISAWRSREKVRKEHDRLVLDGRSQWLVQGDAEVINSLVASVRGIAHRVGRRAAILDFGNAVGLVELPGLGRVEIVSDTLDAATFNQLLVELTEIVAELPFSVDTTTALPYDRSIVTRDDVLYHAYVYVRHILSNEPAPEDRLLPAVDAILRDPHRQFTTERHLVPLDRLRDADAITLLDLVSTSALTAAPAAPGRVVEMLRGRLPARIGERRVIARVDTAENRFVKAFLQQVLAILVTIRERAPRRGGFTQQLIRESEALERDLRPFARHSLWDEIGSLTHLPLGSTVLHGRIGYRTVFKHFVRLRLAARVHLDSSIIRDILEAKDIALLYELWVFFTIAKRMTERIGQPQRAIQYVTEPFQKSVELGIGLEWPNDVRLLYNPSFSSSREVTDPLRRSYSVGLRPDIALVIPASPRTQLHLFDAKCRVEWLGATDKDDDKRGIYRRADLYKMHTYRDAIPASRTAWAVYPGIGGERTFFDVGIGHDAKHGGVGAIPARPGNLGELDRVLDELLDAAGQIPSGRGEGRSARETIEPADERSTTPPAA
ncbi:MAG: hypothetical protein KatS3mg060_2057 [Dehalococcoidia bacterium]|nr:MAG: hypothetical protein KatS3mg060_2057 [Dehalococcoidia bacterium]